MSNKKKEKTDYGQGTNNSIIFNASGAKLTEEQLKLKIQLEARKASQGGSSSSRVMSGSMRASLYKRR
ncbi:MAG: hypothetical protein EA357_00200 [Micavibrio sp.]|nr:MAG: hypothetical protein EA357_00200 [Micavibrio sp.]